MGVLGPPSSGHGPWERVSSGVSGHWLSPQLAAQRQHWPPEVGKAFSARSHTAAPPATCTLGLVPNLSGQGGWLAAAPGTPRPHCLATPAWPPAPFTRSGSGVTLAFARRKKSNQKPR